MKKIRLFLIVPLLSLFSLWSCKDKTQSPLEYSRFIAGYTQGMIRSGDPVYIRLETHELTNSDSLSVAPEELLKVTPSIPGTVTFRDGMIHFRPSERFKSGQTYQFSLRLNKIAEVPSDLKTFQFEVKILPQSFSFEEGSLSIDPNAENQLFYTGYIISADIAAPEQVEKFVKANLKGQSLSMSWEHTPYRHTFTIRNVARTEETQNLTLTFDKQINNGNDLILEIPGFNNFSVLEAQAIDDGDKTINIVMSDNLDPAQDLQGLISIEGIDRLSYNIQGNIIRVYSDQKDKMQGVIQLTLHKGIQSRVGDKLKEDYNQQIHFPSTKPEVQFIGQGVFMPTQGDALLPFTAVGLKAVQLKVVKVFSQNMNFFLQQSSYDYTYDYELRRVARVVLNKKISLEQEGKPFNPNKWQDYTINLADHLPLEKGVIYRVQLLFQRSYTAMAESNDRELLNTNDEWDEAEDQYGGDYYDEYDDYYYSYPYDFNWSERDDPASNSYYYVQERFPKKNIIATALGVTVKAGLDGKYVVAVNDLYTTAPVEHAQISFYNYQNQKIDSARTNSEGIASRKVKGKPFVVLVQKGNDKTYLKVNEGSTLSFSNFDVSGAVVQKGIKGFIYGERGVWRPGNDIHLAFMLEDKEQVIPVGHPIIAELYDPNGNVVQTRKESRNERGLYYFPFQTDEDAITGYWRVMVKIGGATFHKTIRIETVKPNRLNIDIQLPGNILGEGIRDSKIPVKTRWLHGAKTSLLKTNTELKLSQSRTSFEGYKGYVFDDYAKYFHPYSSTLFEGQTDEDGNFTLDIDEMNIEGTPGMLNALLTTQVFENSGDFSIVTSSFKYSPYKEYVGIKLQENESGWYVINNPIHIEGANLRADGQAAGESQIEVEVYTLSWRWWWDSEYDNIGSYVNRSYKKPVFEKTLTSRNGKFSFDVNCKEWGRYYVVARNKTSGHSTGTTFYVSRYSYGFEIPGAATLLTLTSDKQQYNAGEKIKIKFPSSAGGVALVSLENGKTVKDIFRVPTTAGSTTFEITATDEMCPNIYVNVSLIQPHNNRDNDQPIRLYGVLNINVEDPALHLTPRIDMAEELRPSQDFTVTVSETNGKPMTYTLAVVDEGLLSITSFKTPDPFPVFYAREALGVKTWDFYDNVFGAYGARLEKAFAVGGDETLDSEAGRKSDRFTPVVIFRGPFTLQPGEKKKHTLKMPEYIGEVRTMVIAEDNGKYGSAHKNTPVNKPLMLNVTMPRLFTPGDIIEIPVTLFAMKDFIKEVNVNILTDDKLQLIGEAQQQVRFNAIGEQMVFFRVKILENTGTSTITFTAKSGKEEAYFSTDVEVRIPNPRVTRVDAREIAPGQEVSFNNELPGVEPQSMLEITSIPALNLEQRLGELIRYPHGCAEQITSAVYPQLMLPGLTDLSEAQRVTSELHIKEVISRLRRYQLSNGGFSYWAGYSNVSDWVSTYITDFLINAEKQGYQVPASMKNSALNYLTQKANSWRVSGFYSEIEQSYRLYVLAAAGKTNLPAMNRMKEIDYKNAIARWQLASAYAISKHEQVARTLIANLPPEAPLYRQLGRCYGSTLRDNAIILQSMVNMDMKDEAFNMVAKMAKRFSSGEWLSTQESAFGLCAIGNYVKRYFATGNGIDVLINNEAVSSTKTVVQRTLAVKDQRSVAKVKNNTGGTLHVRTINSSIPLGIITQSEMSGLNMEVKYYRNDELSTEHRYNQGEDIVVEITIRNSGQVGRYDELALTYMFPSGFEFYNERLTAGINPFPQTDNADIRDDRVYLYFSLEEGRSKKFKLRFNAAYSGTYMLPAVNCSAMYDNSITATLPGSTLSIVRE